MTKDEKFLIALYHLVGKSEETTSPLDLAERLGLSPKQLKNVVHGLCKANFVKLLSSDRIALTSRGVELAERLITE